MIDPSFLNKAILFYGPRKSGSTLLMNLLDGGSQMLMLPGELKLKPQIRKTLPLDERLEKYLQKGRKDLERLTQFNRETRTFSVREDFCFESLTVEQTHAIFDAQSYLARMTTLLENPPEKYGDLVRFDVETFASCVKPEREYSCWSAKEVGGADSQSVLDFFRLHFPDARVVLQTREPMFIVRSIIMDRRRKGSGMNFQAVWRECWEAQEIINFVYENIGREIVVAYETLTRDTEAQTRYLASQLKLPFEPIFCQPTTLGIPVVVRTASQKTTGVFQQGADWTKNLNSIQIAAMKLFQKAAPAKFKQQGKTFVVYTDLLDKLNETQNKIGS